MSISEFPKQESEPGNRELLNFLQTQGRYLDSEMQILEWNINRFPPLRDRIAKIYVDFQKDKHSSPAIQKEHEITTGLFLEDLIRDLKGLIERGIDKE